MSAAVGFHSPGPWTFQVRVLSLYIVRDADGKEICAVMPNQAPLIAAAPELLAVLQQLVAFQEGANPATCAIALEVIAKATGAAA